MDIEKLKALCELKEKGILSDDEFLTEKNKILSAQNEIPVVNKTEKGNDSLVVIGYVMSLMPILILPIVFTPIGVALGVLNVSRGKVGHGSAQFGISIFCGFIGTAIGGAGFGL